MKFLSQSLFYSNVRILLSPPLQIPTPSKLQLNPLYSFILFDKNPHSSWKKNPIFTAIKWNAIKMTNIICLDFGFKIKFYTNKNQFLEFSFFCGKEICENARKSGAVNNLHDSTRKLAWKFTIFALCLKENR